MCLLFLHPTNIDLFHRSRSPLRITTICVFKVHVLSCVDIKCSPLKCCVVICMKLRDTTVKDTVVFHLSQDWPRDLRLRQHKLSCSLSFVQTTHLHFVVTVVTWKLWNWLSLCSLFVLFLRLHYLTKTFLEDIWVRYAYPFHWNVTVGRKLKQETNTTYYEYEDLEEVRHSPNPSHWRHLYQVPVCWELENDDGSVRTVCSTGRLHSFRQFLQRGMFVLSGSQCSISMPCWKETKCFGTEWTARKRSWHQWTENLLWNVQRGTQ